jgi:polar amino acid transport system permease protein
MAHAPGSLYPIKNHGELAVVLCFVFRSLPVGVRAGAAAFKQIDRSLDEASTLLHARTATTLRRIVLPQALRVIVPPLGNEFNNMLKTTSLLSVIAVEEIFRVADAANSATFKAFEAYFGVALYYLALTTIWSFIQGRIERRLGVSSARDTDRQGVIARLTGLRRVSTDQGGLR